MGYEFDDNGKYVGWSDLFDYSNIEVLKASEYLPIPDGRAYEKRDTGFDISNYITRIAESQTKTQKLRIYADLLCLLQDLGKTNGITYVTWDNDVDQAAAEQVLADINIHSKTYLSPLKIEKCLKNSVSSSITNIIQNIRNMDLAYSPIEMDKVRGAAKNSPKGSKADKMTLVNPLTKFLMQEQNMVGKGVIGITAVGEKVFFNVSHYWNEGIRSRNEEWIKNLQFSLTFNRILGRATNSITSVTKTTLANVNFESVEDMRLRFANISGIDKTLKAKYSISDFDVLNKTDNWKNYLAELYLTVRQDQDSDVYADDIVSLLLSAATDNAKELILSKINADTTLARCYLHLIMMGFDINDIVSFMTSPVVQIISDISSANMFDEYMFKMNISDVINILKGKFPLSRFFYGLAKDDFLDIKSVLNIAFDRLHEKLQTKLQSLGYVYTKKVNGVDTVVPKTYKYLAPMIEDYFNARIYKKGFDEPLSTYIPYAQANTKINHNLLAFSDYIESVISRVKNSGLSTTDFLADLNEFDKVYKLATETSTLGSVFLGLNQGIPTSKLDLLSKVFNIQKAVADREKLFHITEANLGDENTRNVIIENIIDNNSFLKEEDIVNTLDQAKNLGIVNNFSFTKWLENLSGYRKVTSDYYNLIKGTWNIFDIINKLPHFNAIFQAFRAVLTFDLVSIKKSYLLDQISKDLFKNEDYINEQTITKLIDYIDDLLILRWLNNLQLKYPVFEGDTVFRQDWKAELHKGQSAFIVIDSEANRGTFKKLIEENLLPYLQEGYYYDVDENGNLVKIELEGKNSFIDNLVLDLNNQGLPYLRLDLDMQNVDSTASNENRYQKCLSDFIKLKNKKLYERPLTDLFMVYNLIVNKNKFGSDRLTTLFDLFIKMAGESSIIKSILSSTGEFDYAKLPESLLELGYNRDDALFRIAPIISKSLERNTTMDMVKEYLDGRIIVKRRVGDSYQNAEEIIPKSSDSIMDERELKVDILTRLLNYLNHCVIQTPFANKVSSAVSNLESGDMQLIVSALRSYMTQGILDIYTENC